MLRVATYNIRKCVGLDWKRRPERVMRVLAELKADVVLLQEADRRFGSRRGTLPADALSEHTGLRLEKVDAESPSHGHCGNALLVGEGVHVRTLEALRLPSSEPRGAIIAEISKGGSHIRVAGAHLGLLAADRRRQILALLEAFQARADGMPELLLGDFNAWRIRSGSLSLLSSRFEDAYAGGSFHSASPIAPLDRIFVGPGVAISHIGVHRSPISEKASDHLPVWADLRIAEAPFS